jgi:hypothetical protein
MWHCPSRLPWKQPQNIFDPHTICSSQALMCIVPIHISREVREAIALTCFVKEVGVEHLLISSPSPLREEY